MIDIVHMLAWLLLAFGAFGVSRCCCGLTCACCAPDRQPSSLIFDITIAGSDECCTALNASFEVSEDSSCHYELTVTDFCDCGVTTGLRLVIAADISDAGGGDCMLDVTIQVITLLDVVAVEIILNLLIVDGDCCGILNDAMTLDTFTNLGTCNCAEPVTVEVSATC